MKDRFAYFLSLVFHPLLMPTYLFLFVMFMTPSLLEPIMEESLPEVLVIIIIVTFLIPALSIGALRLSNFISDIHLADKNQRTIPFLFVCCFYGVTAYMFYEKLSINNLLPMMFASMAVLLLILTIINFFWKISTHGAGIGGFIGFLSAIQRTQPVAHAAEWLALVTFIAGLVFFARLKLNAHTPAQVYAGFAAGMMVSYVSVYYFL